MNRIIWDALVWVASGAWSCVTSYGEWSTCWATMFCWGKGGRLRADRFTEHRIISRNRSQDLEIICDIKIVPIVKEWWTVYRLAIKLLPWQVVRNALVLRKVHTNTVFRVPNITLVTTSPRIWPIDLQLTKTTGKVVFINNWARISWNPQQNNRNDNIVNNYRILRFLCFRSDT